MAAAAAADCVEIGLLVEDDHQRKGIGTELISTILADAAAQGWPHARFNVPGSNRAALRAVLSGCIRTTITRDADLLHVTMGLRALPLARTLNRES